MTVTELQDRPRAGFWRRVGALTIDMILVTLPFQVVAVVLFAVSNGMLQETAGLDFSVCHQVQSEELAKYGTLSSPPPEGANYVLDCDATLFGLPTARMLVIGRRTDENNITKNVWVTYPLNASGQLAQAYNWDWLVKLAFAVYYLGLLSRTGRTFGMRRLTTQLISLDKPDAPVGLWRVLLRYLVMSLPAMPMLLLMTWIIVQSAGNISSYEKLFFSNVSSPWFLSSIVGGVLLALWMVASIVQREDPLYDRAAKTAVVVAKAIV